MRASSANTGARGCTPSDAGRTLARVSARFRFEGSYVAVVTPFREDGALDEGALRSLVRWHAESGTDGIVPCGTTGESATLGHDEHEKVVEIVIDEARRVAGSGGRRLAVLAGTGSNATAGLFRPSSVTVGLVSRWPLPAAFRCRCATSTKSPL